MDKAAEPRSPGEGQSTTAALPLRPHFVAKSADAPRRVIRKIFVVDPKKFNTVRLEQKIDQALTKLNDKVSSRKNIEQNILQRKSTAIIKGSPKSPIVPTKNIDSSAATEIEARPFIESEKILKHPKEKEVSSQNSPKSPIVPTKNTGSADDTAIAAKPTIELEKVLKNSKEQEVRNRSSPNSPIVSTKNIGSAAATAIKHPKDQEVSNRSSSNSLIVPTKNSGSATAIEARPIIESEKILKHPKEQEGSNPNVQRKLTTVEVKSLLSRTLLERVQGQHLKKRESATKTLNFIDSEKSRPIKSTKPSNKSPYLKPPPLQTTEQILKKRLEEINFADGFNGFTDQQITSDRHVLERLADIIAKSKSQSADRIPSFSNLRTYLSHKKYSSPVEEDSKCLSSDQSSSCSIAPEKSPAAVKNIATNSKLNNGLVVASESKSISCSKFDIEKINETRPVASSSSNISNKPPRRRPVPILKLGKRSASVSSSTTSKPTEPEITKSETAPKQNLTNSLILEKQTDSDSKIDEINLNRSVIHPVPINTVVNRTSPTSLPDKGIIVLDHKVYKPGISIPSFLTNAELVPKGDLIANSGISLPQFLTNNTTINPGNSIAPSREVSSNYALPSFIPNTDSNSIALNREINQNPGLFIQSLLNESQTSIVPNCEDSQSTAERTIILKVLNRDPVSNDIQFEVVDPLLESKHQKKMKTDPIKNICKSYVKKMFRTGIKQIQIKSSTDSNPMPPFNLANYDDRGCDERETTESQSTVNQPMDYQKEMAASEEGILSIDLGIENQQEDLSTCLTIQDETEICAQELETVESVAEMLQSVPQLHDVELEMYDVESITKVQNFESFLEIQSVEPVAEIQPVESMAVEPAYEIQPVEPDAEMDAVEYIFSYSKNNLSDDDKTSPFEEDKDNLIALSVDCVNQQQDSSSKCLTVQDETEICVQKLACEMETVEPVAEMLQSVPELPREIHDVESITEKQNLESFFEIQSVEPISEIQPVEPIARTQAVESVVEMRPVEPVCEAIKPAYEMDAVEYILSCIKDKLCDDDKTSQFEEDEDDLYDDEDFDSDSDYDDDVDEPMAEENNSQSSYSSNKMKDANINTSSTAEQSDSQNQQNPVYEFAVNSEIISLIERAEITFESDIKQTPELLSVIDLSSGITKNIATTSNIVITNSTAITSADDQSKTGEQLQRPIIQPISYCSQEISASITAETKPEENQILTICKEPTFEEEQSTIEHKAAQEDKSAIIVADITPNENRDGNNRKETNQKKEQVALSREEPMAKRTILDYLVHSKSKLISKTQSTQDTQEISEELTFEEEQVPIERKEVQEEKSATIVANIIPNDNQAEKNPEDPNQKNKQVALSRKEGITKRSQKRTILDYLVHSKSKPVPKTQSTQDKRGISEERKFTGEPSSCILAAVELKANTHDSTIEKDVSKKKASSMKSWSKIVQSSLNISPSDEPGTTATKTNISETTQTDLNRTKSIASEGNSEAIISNSNIEKISNRRSQDGSLPNKMKFCSRDEKNLSFLDSACKRAKIKKDLESTKATNKEKSSREKRKSNRNSTDKNLDELSDAEEMEKQSKDIVNANNEETQKQETALTGNNNSNNETDDENQTEPNSYTFSRGDRQDCVRSDLMQRDKKSEDYKHEKKIKPSHKSKNTSKHKKKTSNKIDEKAKQLNEDITRRRKRTNIGLETHSDRKSTRIRKPSIKSDFVMESKNVRKESNSSINSTKSVEMKDKLDFGIKRIQNNNHNAPIDESQTNETQSAAITMPKVKKSRRKNTIPEIDKLGLDRKARKTISESQDEITADRSNLILGPDNLNEVTADSFSKPKKRKYKSKTVKATEDVIMASQSDAVKIPEKAKKRTKRSRRISSDNHDNTEAEEDGEDDFNPKRIKTDPDPESNKVFRKKFARTRKMPTSDCFIHPKLLLVESRTELDKEFDITIEEERIGGAAIKIEPEDNDDFQDLVQCGTCKQIVNEKIFADHLKRHYGVGWREGKDVPINLSSYREVLNAMVYFMKMNKVPFFNCKFCGEMKRSAIGIMGHIQICQLSQSEINDLLETCEFCSKRFMPFLMLTHAKSCKAALIEPEIRPDQVYADENGRVKRQSHLKANSSFKDMMNPEYKLSANDLIKPYAMPRGGLSIKWKSSINRDGKAKCYESKCSFESSDLDELKTHVKTCVHIRRGGFCCVRCKYYNIDREAVQKHVEKKHKREFSALIPKEPDDERTTHTVDPECDFDNENSDGDSESSGLDEDECMDSEKSISISQKMKLGFHFPSFNHRQPLLVRNFVESTESIRTKIYTNEILYPNAFAHDISILEEPFDIYKPGNHRSMKFNFNFTSKVINKPIGSIPMPSEWLEMETFESYLSEEGGMIFIGGPITTLAWVPMPPSDKTDTSEYLAVSYKFNYDTHIMANTPEQYKSLILVYKIDVEKVSKKPVFQSKPELLYALSCIGPVHHLAFLPSGGYAPEINRLGLLAVASVQSEIEVFALPIKAPEYCDTYSPKLVNILDIKPSLVLCLELGNNLSSSRDYLAQCTRIVWSEIKNHNIIGAGFSNGFVGLWDIRDECNLTKFEMNNSKYFIPLSYFRGLSDSITGMEFHYNQDGPKWLAVTSHIRELRSFDLDDMTNPLLVCQDQAQKSSLSDIIWPIYSENPIISMNDDYVEDSCTTLARSLLNVTYKIKHSLHSPTGINSLTFSPWHNALIGACDNGDVVIQKFKTVSMENISANAYARRYVYYTDIIRLDGQQIPNVNQKSMKANLSDAALASLESFENDYKEKYGIIFGGLAIPYDRTNKDAQSLTRIPPFSLRPLTRIKCIKLCPNNTNPNILAVGYNNGFIRIKIMDFRHLV